MTYFIRLLKRKIKIRFQTDKSLALINTHATDKL